jgi:hypothetical protein
MLLPSFVRKTSLGYTSVLNSPFGLIFACEGRGVRFRSELLPHSYAFLLVVLTVHADIVQDLGVVVTIDDRCRSTRGGPAVESEEWDALIPTVRQLSKHQAPQEAVGSVRMGEAPRERTYLA